jgi:hypothetical protein|tara:strand:+ start:4219 stop:4731 length:513 start_codon:yes stop_codon:yes gene_type:complete
MISTRNATRTLVVGKHAVPVRDITEAVCDREELDYILKRFPISKDEVFESIDAVSDLDPLNAGTHLKVEDISTEEDIITLNVLTVSDIMYLKLVQYGRVVLPKEVRFNVLFDYGLMESALDCYSDIANGNDSFMSSEMHETVYNAVQKACSDTYSTDQLLNLLKEQTKRK